jgi:hypothetical protein
MNAEFKQWLEQQTYRRYYPGIISANEKELSWHWVNEEYDDSDNWNWNEIKEIYYKGNPYESRI